MARTSPVASVAANSHSMVVRDVLDFGRQPVRTRGVPYRADFPRGCGAFGANGANRRVEFRTFGANGVSGPAAGLGPRARQLAVRTPQFVLTPLPARPAGFTIEPGILNRSPAEGECRSDQQSSQEYCVHTQYNGT